MEALELLTSDAHPVVAATARDMLAALRPSEQFKAPQPTTDRSEPQLDSFVPDFDASQDGLEPLMLPEPSAEDMKSRAAPEPDTHVEESWPDPVTPDAVTRDETAPASDSDAPRSHAPVLNDWGF